jgi:hypothetical protein
MEILLYFKLASGSTQFFEFFEDFQENEWNHYVITFDVEGTNVGSQLYINGVSAGSLQTKSDGYGDINMNFYLGTRGKGDGTAHEDSFYGEIDEFRVYNKVLSESEITQLYNIGLE